MEFNLDLHEIPSPYITESHKEWRAQLRRFINSEIDPHIEEWEEAGRLPQELYEKAGGIGLLGLHYPEDLGGITEGTDLFHLLLSYEELGRMGAGGVAASLMVHNIALPLVAQMAQDEIKKEVVPAVLSGKKQISLGITEPNAGSDVSRLSTRADRDGDYYIVNGSKIYITGAMVADYLTCAVRTGGETSGGISLLLIDMHADGVSRNPLSKQGWLSSDTAEIFFDDVKVPAINLIGAENQGFKGAMNNFNLERLVLAAGCIGASRRCLKDAVEWARQRHTFGQRLADHQVIRHKIAEMIRQINAASAYADLLTWNFQNGRILPGELALLKVSATTTMEFCAREAMQILGGISYMRGGAVERIYREVRVNAIGGGSEEIMRDLASRQYSI